MKTLWSEEARKNLLLIIEYVRQDSPTRAWAFAKKIEAKVSRLARFPASGRIVPELEDESIPPREIIIGDYRLVYRIHHKTIEIVTVFHGMRQFPFFL